ncbi:MAG: glycoside hydrolase family 3 C-terminal domain-containing protein [Bacilli bacterium]|nr:glycoside hydrolase family 3 C-terminal domain-containing protein [Bacilli bacterium]
MPKPKLWMGLSGAAILLSTMMFAGQSLVTTYEGLIRDVIGGSTTKVDVNPDTVEGSAYKDPVTGALTEEGWKQMITDSYKFCEQAVEQGAVLFKNAEKDGKPVLPLAKEERKISLLGRGSKNLFMRSGAGGAAPNEDLVVRLDAAFEDNGFKINRTIFDKYSSLDNKAMTTPSTKVEQPFDDFYTSEMMDSLSEYSDAAVITFVRIGTENTDPSNGTLDLKDDEAKLLKMVKDSGVFKKTIVLINSPMPMSMDWVDNEEYGVDACIYMGVPGYYGTPGIVHVLMGEDAEGNVVNPSGHAPDTFAANASSSAAYQNFGDSNCVVYKEGVYVGYKYYETRYADAVLGQGNADGAAGTYNSADKTSWNYADEMGYPFGYGLSYTTFDQKLTNIAYDENTDQIEATVTVENTGSMAGKASIQLYVQQPYTDYDKTNGLGRPAIALMAYDKVDVEPGKKVEKKLSFDRYFLATYDHVVNKSYLLEGGKYYFAIGNGAHEALNNVLGSIDNGLNLVDHLGEVHPIDHVADKVKSLDIAEESELYRMSHYNEESEVTNQFDDADYNWMANKNGKATITYLDRQDWQGTWPTKTTSNPANSDDLNMAQYYKKTADTPSYKEGDGTVYNVPYVNDEGVEEKIAFADMAKVPLTGPVEEGKFAGKEGSEIWDAFIKQMDLADLAISVTDNRGILDVLKVLKKGNSVAEGPEGLLSKFAYGDNRWATGFPTGPVYTATFDHEMQRKFGGFYGEEALYCGVACVNAPGANINRTPYGSRASEYMSEDGILNYNVATNVIGEARRKGLIMNIKHCFLNNQETGRQRVSTWCNEQAIREIYLRPFEGALTKGHGLGIMTSYNRIGARYAATHEPLMMNVMRGEWNYKGLIIDDALTGSNTDSYSNGPAMLYCGTDLFCLDGNRGSQLVDWVKGNDDGTILECMQRANKNVMYAISRSWMGGLRISEEEIEANANPWWKVTVNVATIATASIAVALTGVYAVVEVLSHLKKKEGE